MQSNGVVSDEVQTQLMVLAMNEVARAIAAQPPAPMSTGVKPAGGKPAASKGSPKAAKLARKAAPKQQKAPAIAHQSLAAKLV